MTHLKKVNAEMYAPDYVYLAARVAHGVMQQVNHSFNLPTMAQFDVTPVAYQKRIKEDTLSILIHGKQASSIHHRWLSRMLDDGWTVGERNNELKQHPYLVPWNDLPVEIRFRMRQFRAAVIGFRKTAGLREV